MKLRDQLLCAAAAFCAAGGIGRKRLSTLLFNDGKRLDALADGRDLQTTTFEAAMQWLSDNWPDDADWPEGVKRPTPRVEAAE